MSDEDKTKDNRKTGDTNIVLANEVLPEVISILPMINRPIFPGVMLPVILSGKEVIDTINDALENSQALLGAVLIKEASDESLLKSELYETGTIIKIHKAVQIDAETVQVLINGLERFKKKDTISDSPVIKWQVKYYPDREDNKNVDELKAYTLEIISSVKELLKLNSLFQEQLRMLMSHFTSERPGKIMDLIASMTTADSDKLQNLLETMNLIERGNKLLVILREEIEVSRLQEKIKKNIDEKVNQQQKKFLLQEQLKVIKKELGLEKDDKTTEIEKFENRIKKLKLSKEAQSVVEEELNKIRLLEPSSSEYHVVRTYLDWLTELPWGIFTNDRMDIRRAKKILNDTHYGLDDIKERILEFISTAKKKGELSGSIICLIGPPGVGKTSIGKSIAEALNRKFYRFSIGGMRDEAEIKGHRRTYIGAMPGKFIQTLKRVGTSNPVIMLDEIDKVGKSFQGDPAAALLEVLDPEQNRDFLDHYLDVRFDLSNVLFITTANQYDTIPAPLLDRMEVLVLSGYVMQEKLEIAKRFLIPNQLKEHGLTDKDISFEDGAIGLIINKYAREAGVRTLEKFIKKIMRRITYNQATGKTGLQKITSENLEKYIGKPIFPDEELYNKDVAGVALGLAWTSMGGSTLYIEARAIKSKNSGFKQTGQLGKVMKESSEIAYSYVRSLLCTTEESNCFFQDNFIHLHVPAGATPKDGPSAGITMATALYSLALNKPVRNDIAMTGELTLTGKVLPIGGVREKIIAAKRVGINEIILPKDNERDFNELPPYIRKGMKANYADYYEDVIKIAFRKL